MEKTQKRGEREREEAREGRGREEAREEEGKGWDKRWGRGEERIR